MPIEKKSNKPILRIFILGFMLAFLIFIPYIIIDKGYFTYYGDFNVQQIPFYKMAHEAIRSGEIGWAWNLDLGANFIGSNSFYMLGSPFFWVTLLFPTSFVPHLMAPLLILKFAFTCVTAFLYLRRFLSDNNAIIGSLLYAFSGFSIYNIFFNHFHESILIFPLMLLCLEKYMTEGKKGMFAITVFFSALNNYYFFIGQCVFLIIYFFIRMFSGDWKLTFSKFISLAFEAVIGTAMATVLLLPSFLTIIQNPRTEESLAGFDVLIHNSSQRFFDIIHSFFFPQALPGRVSFFPDSNNKWASMTAWLPVFAFTGVIAYFQSRKHTDWIKRIITVSIFIALVPVLNNLFQLTKGMYYARWFYMMILFLVLATMKNFDESDYIETNWKRAIKATVFVIAFFGIIIGLTPLSWNKNPETGVFEFGLYGDLGFFLVGIIFAVLGVVVTSILVSLHRHNRNSFNRWATVSVSVVAVIFGLYSIGVGKVQSFYGNDFVIEKAIKGEGKVDIERTNNSRVDFYDDMANMGIYWNMPSLQTFHSIVPGSIHEFYNSIGIVRSVKSEPAQTRYALRSFLSVEWIFKHDKDLSNLDEVEKNKYETALANIPAVSLYDKQFDYDIYKNEAFIPFGFTYDYYLTRSQYDDLPESSRELALLKAIVIEDEDLKDFEGMYEPLKSSPTIFSESYYLEDCKTLKKGAAKTFETTKKGFKSNIDSDKETLVFFSIPYEDGWTATVNGKTATIYKTNVGFMSVLAEEGNNDIQFYYKTPGLKLGIIISLGALLLFALYMTIYYISGHRKAKKGLPQLPTESATSLPSNSKENKVLNLRDDLTKEEKQKDFNIYKYYSPDDNDNNNDDDD